MKKGPTIQQRKKEHLKLCSTDEAAFRWKTAGFESYDFRHFALTEVNREDIDLTTDFFGTAVSLPFLISCMTGGTDEADNINLQLAEAAKELNIPLGLGSMRYALEAEKFTPHLKAIRDAAGSVPLLSNIGAAQVVEFAGTDSLQRLVDMVEAAAMVIHLNPLQELLQPEGETVFTGLLKEIERLASTLSVPLIVKEVGSGIDAVTALPLLKAGVKGIDAAGAGGTSWAGVEMIRSQAKTEPELWDWGFPTAFCIRSVAELKKNYEFLLIGSGGINGSFDAAKALALGADMTASARIMLHALNDGGPEMVVKRISDWFGNVRSSMFLTGAQTLTEFDESRLINKKEYFKD